MGSLLFWIKKTDPNIDTVDWNAFLDVVSGLLVVAVLAGLALILWRYRVAVRAFKIRSSDDVFRPFTPAWSLLWCMAAFVIMAAFCFGYYEARFRSYLGSFIGDGLALSLIAALLAFALAFGAIAGFGVFTPRKFRYRRLING
jgi:hypothetical protein